MGNKPMSAGVSAMVQDNSEEVLLELLKDLPDGERAKILAVLEDLKTPRGAADETQAAEPKAAEPKAEEPKAEEPKAEESKAEEPKAEEPKAEEPKAEEPKVEEPKAEKKAELTEEQLENVKKTFKACDLDGSGFIEANELKVVMKVLGAEVTDDDVQTIFKSLDVNSDQKIDMDEYLKLIDQALKGTLM